jgi:Fe-S cluster biosynthesis and repair protein YggX
MINYPIPEEFYSFETEKPFDKCIDCRKYLLDENTEYLIEKAIRNYKGYEAKDTVFDYAICMDCAEEMRNDISKESWKSMMNYFNTHLDASKRLEMAENEPRENLGSCMLKNISSKDCEEYQIYAHCRGRYLNSQNPPYMISGVAMDEIIQLLYDKTIDEMNRFFNKHFSPDPSFFEPTPKLILI